MDLKEYNSVKNLTYLEYCDYLQDKYGISPVDYCHKESFNKRGDVTRTNYGLMVHHKYEDHAILLSTKCFAEQNPWEWQAKENLIYCDYLEHLFLHILITEYPSPDKNPNEEVGSGGIGYITKNLNDFWSLIFLPDYCEEYKIRGPLPWQQRCFNIVIGDIDVYFLLCERYFGEPPQIVKDIQNSKQFYKINKTLHSAYPDTISLKVENIERASKVRHYANLRDLTPEEKLEHRRKQNREYMRKCRANMTPEQREKERERKRKQRQKRRSKKT